MSKIMDKFMNMTIRNKMILSFFTIALAPFLIYAIISLSIFTNRVEKNITEHANQMMEQVKTALDVYINSLEKVSNYIVKEIEGSDFFNMQSANNIFYESENRRIGNYLDDFADTHPEIAGILIVNKNDMYISNNMKRITRNSFKEEDWYKQAVSDPAEIQIISNITGRNITTDESYSADEAFSLVKAIIDPRDNTVTGVILMDVKHEIFDLSIESITIGEKGFVYVMDESEKVVYTPVNSVIYRIQPDLVLSHSSFLTTNKIQGETYQIRHIKSDYTGWNIVGVFSVDEIMGNLNTMFYILLSCLCLMTAFIIYISLKLSMTITKPLVQLKKIMKNAESGNLTVRFDSRYQDEVNELGRSFNHMLERIDNLMQLVYIEQKNKRYAELKVLQEQIKPHFLYNTLDTISWMAREYEADDIVHLVDALTSMFRIGLSRGRDYITVEQEIGYVSNYLHIQKIRYRSKLNYKIRDDENLWEYEVPKLILQPLVENAIYHGIKTTGKDGHLIIEVMENDDGYMVFSVEDDGSGMTKEKEKELNRLLNEPTELEENQSFGLFYIKERLRLRYGDDFKVRVESEEGLGTKVILVIPKKKV